MDNVIPPLNTPQVSTPSADKNLTGTIGSLTSQTVGEAIAPGQSAVLEVLGRCPQCGARNPDRNDKPDA